MTCRDCRQSIAALYCRKCQYDLCEACSQKHVARAPFPETHLGYLQPVSERRHAETPRYSAARNHDWQAGRGYPDFDARPTQLLDRFASEPPSRAPIESRRSDWHERDDRVEVLIIGDSLIQDFSTRTYTRRHIIYLRKLHCVITGVAHATVGAVLHRLQQGLLASCPAPPLHTVVLCVGSDDCEAYSLQEIFRNTVETVAYIRQQRPAVRIILLGLPPRLNSVGVPDEDLRRKILELNRVYESIPSTLFLDLWPHFVTHSGERDGNLYENYQLFNARGYDKFSRLLVYNLGFEEEPSSAPRAKPNQGDQKRRHRIRGRRGASNANDLWDDPDDVLGKDTDKYH